MKFKAHAITAGISAALSVVTVLALSACAAPSVRYEIYTSSAKRSAVGSPTDSFALARTQLTMTPEQITEDDITKTAVNVEVARIPHPDFSVGIIPERKWYGVSTTVNLVKTDNTNMIQSASSLVEDKRIEFVRSAAKLVGTALGLPADAAAAGGRSLDGPTIVDVLAVLKEKKVGREASPNLAINAVATLDVGALPPDAIEFDPASFPNGKMPSDWSHVLFYSACRPALLHVTVDDEVTLLPLVIADPRYVQTVAFPRKGQISLHSQCGVSVTSETVALQSGTDILEAAISELRKLRERQSKKGDDAED